MAPPTSLDSFDQSQPLTERKNEGGGRGGGGKNTPPEIFASFLVIKQKQKKQIRYP